MCSKNPTENYGSDQKFCLSPSTVILSELFIWVNCLWVHQEILDEKGKFQASTNPVDCFTQRNSSSTYAVILCPTSHLKATLVLISELNLKPYSLNSHKCRSIWSKEKTQEVLQILGLLLPSHCPLIWNMLKFLPFVDWLLWRRKGILIQYFTVNLSMVSFVSHNFVFNIQLPSSPTPSLHITCMICLVTESFKVIFALVNSYSISTSLYDFSFWCSV